MRFFRQEYWSGWPFPSPGDLPNPGMEPRFPALRADSLLSELWGKTSLQLRTTNMPPAEAYKEWKSQGPLWSKWSQSDDEDRVILLPQQQRSPAKFVVLPRCVSEFRLIHSRNKYLLTLYLGRRTQPGAGTAEPTERGKKKPWPWSYFMQETCISK